MVAELAKHRLQLTLDPLDAAVVSASLYVAEAAMRGDQAEVHEGLTAMAEGVAGFGPLPCGDPTNHLLAHECLQNIAAQCGAWLEQVHAEVRRVADG